MGEKNSVSSSNVCIYFHGPWIYQAMRPNLCVGFIFYADINFIHDSLTSKMTYFGQFCADVHFYFDFHFFLKWFCVRVSSHNSDIYCIFHKVCPNNFSELSALRNILFDFVQCKY